MGNIAASSSASGSAQATLPPIWNYHGNGLGQNHALPHIQDGRGNGNAPSAQRSYQDPLPQWDHIATHTHSHGQSNGSSHSQLHGSGQKSPPLYGVGTATSSLFPNVNSAGFYDSRVERISRDNCKSTPPISPIKPLVCELLRLRSSAFLLLPNCTLPVPPFSYSSSRLLLSYSLLRQFIFQYLFTLYRVGIPATETTTLCLTLVEA